MERVFGGVKFDYERLITHAAAAYLCFSKQWSTLKVNSNTALVAHFTRVDLAGFRDFNSLKTRFDAVRKTYCPNALFSRVFSGNHR